MSFLFPDRKPSQSQTMWVQGPTVDWGQVRKFFAPTPSSRTVTTKTETRRSAILVKKLPSSSNGDRHALATARPSIPGSSNGDCQALATARPSTDEPPVMDALEAALKYRGFYICTTRKRS